MSEEALNTQDEESLTLSFRPAALRQFIADALRTVGMDEGDARASADVLATADEFGVSTHGSKLLPAYLVRLRGGGTRPQGRPSILAEGPAWGLIDGDHALGMIVGNYGMNVAIEKATSAGIAYVGARHSSHFGPAGYYALLAARQGLIGITVANDTPSVVAPGAKRSVLGTNPFAYAIPARRHPPILLDIAISTVAGGKVYASRVLGKPIPDNWIVGRDGLPTSDATLYPEQAYLVPAAGHKGYGLGLLIEVLSALVTGAHATWSVGSWMHIDSAAPSHHGAAFIAIDPGILGSRDEFVDRVDALIDEIHATPAIDGVERIIVPGEREFARQRRAALEPIVLPEDVAANIRRAAALTGLRLADYVEAGRPAPAVAAVVA